MASEEQDVEVNLEAGEGEEVPQPPYDDDFDPFKNKDAFLHKLLEEEKCSDPKKGWKHMHKSDHVEVWKKSDSSKPVHLIKAFVNFPGISSQDVVELIHDVEKRKSWDKFFDEIEVIEEHKNFRVIYWLSKMPTGVTDRDVVQMVRKEYDESTDTTYFLYRHATHPKAPEKKGLIRCVTIFTGIIVRPDPEDKSSSKVSMLLQSDLKGWIPHIVMNNIAARSPKSWQEALAKYHRDVYSKK